ncbi:L-threonylcarbamoyladenylate synthase [Carboxylicivirga sp. M1479]|uniref:L-threonylcarbamoyladenylate synthase n=1 Tax=Carboxylicivirga sp. M1479 TaxID=2594476 RepID=UPI001177DED5|nr:L-threonylcarbamoyladenylate synthase [Carboxylicivirga sp. M1479]TRX71023.1 threonylcarbamoyl-AMP synthase [Carboxylicivirga sp. M1479]
MHDDLKQALEILRQGGIILYPTDTIWGVGCDATNADAVKRIYELKQRADSKSMLVLLDNTAKLGGYVNDIPEVAYDMAELTTKPLTIIYDDAKNLAANLLAEDGSVGIRITEEDFSKQLCARFKKPIVSTSANISGEPSPQKFDEVSEAIKEGVDYVVGYRQEETKNPAPSSIIKLSKDGQVTIIRE